jgi:hypothetical protein
VLRGPQRGSDSRERESERERERERERESERERDVLREAVTAEARDGTVRVAAGSRHEKKKRHVRDGLLSVLN